MDPRQMLEMMRDRLGAPFSPELFQALLLITFVVHIFFVTTAVGSSVLTIWGFWTKGDYAIRLARATARITPNTVGLGIVTGIAPLLFLQTIYDPIWYAANALTGFWSVMFVFVVMFGYALAYLFYLKGSKDGRLLWSSVASLILLCFAGWIMHVLNTVSMHPERWMEWYAPNGVVDTRGVQFHAYSAPRFLMLLPVQAGMSLSVVLLLFAWYFGKRPDADHAYLQWTAQLGRRIGIFMSPSYALVGLAWAATQGQEFGVMGTMSISLGILGALLLTFFISLRTPERVGPWALGVWMLALLCVAGIRESIREASLGRFGYAVSEYPYVTDWGSILLFGVTSVVGLTVVLYLSVLLYEAGLSLDGTVSARAERLGQFAVGMLGGWFVFFLLLGAYTGLFLG